VPFALNDATRFVSPTKVPEYLAGGCPVVSTPISDIVAEFSGDALVEIASDARAFAAAIERVLGSKGDRQAWRARVDRWLGATSWDQTWAGMVRCLDTIGRPDADAGSTRAGRQPLRG
jgi:glycosyltransferase involved in cell wall biosynthesis